jgi:23S rRNA (cytidine1920-2'-O)/16S rRNA (cytidine1409-2'-O)-methyltransferase
MEKTNARYLKPERFPQPPDLAVIDCSFISLRKILPPAAALLTSAGRIVALVKPQFEAGKAEADRGRGVIRDASIHERILEELREFTAAQENLLWRGAVESPLQGPAGNKEFLVWIEKAGTETRATNFENEQDQTRRADRQRGKTGVRQHHPQGEPTD